MQYEIDNRNPKQQFVYKKLKITVNNDVYGVFLDKEIITLTILLFCSEIKFGISGKK